MGWKEWLKRQLIPGYAAECLDTAERMLDKLEKTLAALDVALQKLQEQCDAED